ncbi:hypothetical protein EVAR_98295_1 [Eumeta japonica]|uniref:OAR domain-containing protein n=1 Tax=Eumeta variegata TaxID=151549 RepID=A0A4C1XDJ5_EUMVA|nr:hypothetical protein EVAR_98295_1 [Eumeta japonica]
MAAGEFTYEIYLKSDKSTAPASREHASSAVGAWSLTAPTRISARHGRDAVYVAGMHRKSLEAAQHLKESGSERDASEPEGEHERGATPRPAQVPPTHFDYIYKHLYKFYKSSFQILNTTSSHDTSSDDGIPLAAAPARLPPPPPRHPSLSSFTFPVPTSEKPHSAETAHDRMSKDELRFQFLKLYFKTYKRAESPCTSSGAGSSSGACGPGGGGGGGHAGPGGGSSPEPRPGSREPYEDAEAFRNNSIACLRAKAQEHQAKLLSTNLLLQVRNLARGAAGPPAGAPAPAPDDDGPLDIDVGTEAPPLEPPHPHLY